MSRIVNIDGQRCVGCEQCIGVCPVDAIRIEDGIAVVDPSRCTGCGECLRTCPVEAISFPEGEGEAQAPQEAAAQEAPIQAALPEVWVFVEQLQGTAAPVSWELIGHAGKLAADLGGHVAATVLGHDVEPLAKAAIAYRSIGNSQLARTAEAKLTAA